VKKYKRLTLQERYQIYSFLEAGLTRAEIARKIGRDKSTVSKEIHRNKGPDRKYWPERANQKAEHRIRNSHKHTKLNFDMQEIIKDRLEEKWSPEQIAGYCKRKGIKMISHQAIYDYIKEDRTNGGNLYKHLRHSMKRRKKWGSKDHRGQIKNRISIEERPGCVNNKERLGDWEGDLIIGSNRKGVIVTLVERLTGLLVMDRVESKDSEKVANKITSLLVPLVQHVHTITFDNGREFAKHKDISNALGAKIYFAHPYSSFERGANENTNGLVRQYFPKKSSFENISEKGITSVISNLNMRPRKRLGFVSPAEAFAERSSRW